jgi:hypothetical protein
MTVTSALIALAVIAYVLLRRLASSPVNGRRLVVGPLIVMVWGVAQLQDAFGGSLHAVGTDVGLLAVGGVTAIAGGLVRGGTVRLFARDGQLWYRYTAVTMAVWVGLVALRVAQIMIGWEVGADGSVLGQALPLMLGLSLVGEAAMVGVRSAGARRP